MKSKIVTVFFIIFFILTTSVFAENSNIQPLKVDADIYKMEEGTYALDSIVSGNTFVMADEFKMLDSASITGNLYVMADKVYLKSDVTYSSGISKDGEEAIESVNSYATVEGNAFIMCDEFVLEPGAKISGDLYILANRIDIQKSSFIHGNLFAVSSEIHLNGRVSRSVYATSENFNMNYYGSIEKDLHLTAENATLSSVIHRNAYFNSKIITTGEDLLIYGNLESDSHEFNFSGQVDGNAKINSKKINFINTKDNSKIACLISGNLDYSSNEQMQIENNIVNGKVNYSEYIEKFDIEPNFSFKNFVLDLITFVVYVLAVVFIFNLLNKKYKETNHEMNVKNMLIAFGIGLLSFVVIAVAILLLILIQVGVTLGFLVLFAYLFVLFIAIPLFILDIALLFKDKYNVYLTTGVIAVALSLISAIPIIGVFVMFVILMISVGRIYNKVLLKQS